MSTDSELVFVGQPLFEEVHFNNKLIYFKLLRAKPKVWVVRISKREDCHHISY